MAGTTISANNRAVNIAPSVRVWKESATHIAYTPELDISSCGKTPGQAKSRLREAVSLFIEEAAGRGALDRILEEAGFERKRKTLKCVR
jgi:hypothetical protein